MISALLWGFLILVLSVVVASVRDWAHGNDASPWDFTLA